MRTITFRRLLRKAARLSGLDPDRLNPELGRSFAEWLEARLSFAWTAFPWPFLCPIEERAWRDAWDVRTAYAEGAEVSHVNGDGETEYWTALEESEGVEPGTDDAIWEELSTTNRYIAFEQIGKTAFEDVFGVWKDDPRKVRAPRPVSYWLGKDAVHLDRCAPATVFIQFRERTLKLTGEEWDEDEEYSAGDAVYFDGECYIALEQVPTDAFVTITGGATMDGVNIDGTYSDDGIEFSQTRFLREDEGFENVYSGTGSIWKINLYPSPSVSFSGGTSASNPAGTYTGDGPGATGSPVVTLTAATTATPQAGESPETNPEKWQLQEIPLLLAEYAARAAKADYLSDDGQDDKSLAQDRRAIDWLELQMVNITVLQNQTSNYRVRGE